MNRIDNYLESVYKNFNGNKDELVSLKAEMKSHILEEVNELKKSGYDENESITMALDKFGPSHELISDLSNMYTIEKYKPIKVLIILLSSLIILLPLFTLYYDRITFEPRVVYVTLIPMYLIYEFILINYYKKNSININIKYEIMKSLFIIVSLIVIATIIFPLNSYTSLDSMKLSSFSTTITLKSFLNIFPLSRVIKSIILGFLASYVFDIKGFKNISFLVALLPIFYIFINIIISISGFADGMRFITLNHIVTYGIGMFIGNLLYTYKSNNSF